MNKKKPIQIQASEEILPTDKLIKSKGKYSIMFQTPQNRSAKRAMKKK